MQDKQKKIDDLMEVIDKRIKHYDAEFNRAIFLSAVAAENAGFSRFVKKQVKEILDITDGDDCNKESRESDSAKNVKTEDGISIENKTNRAASTGDLVMANGKGNFIVVGCSDRNKWTEFGYTPEGIYVISPTGETGMLSLRNMSVKTPEMGSLSNKGDDVRIPFGGYGVHVDGLTAYIDGEKQPVVNRKSEVIDHCLYGYMPSDKFVNGDGAESPIKGKSYYYNDDDHLLPVPFSDGDRTAIFGPDGSFLSDNNSRANTDALILAAKSQADWLTATEIEKKSSEGYYPAACCCRRFHSEHTLVGDWDLPTIPVLAAIMYDWNKVQAALTNLAADNLAVPLCVSNGYLSSTEYSQNDVYDLNTDDGGVGSWSKDRSDLVRAFCRLPRI